MGSSVIRFFCKLNTSNKLKCDIDNILPLCDNTGFQIVLKYIYLCFFSMNTMHTLSEKILNSLLHVVYMWHMFEINQIVVTSN